MQHLVTTSSGHSHKTGLPESFCVMIQYWIVVRACVKERELVKYEFSFLLHMTNLAKLI